MIYVELFFTFFQIGLFSFGGGYVALSLIQNQVVDINKWLTMVEFTDIINISQITPGPLVINCATFVGIRIAGFGGAVAATIGCIIAPAIIVLILAHFYFKYKNLPIITGILSGLRPAVVAVIGSAGFSILFLSFFKGNELPNIFKEVDFISVFIFIASFVVLRKFKFNPLYIMAGAGVTRVIISQFI